MMYAVALRMGLPDEDAADAVQETQLRLWRRRQALPADEAELRSYCMAALRNECISSVRKKKLLLSGDISGIEMAVGAVNETEQADSIRHLKFLMRNLPEGQRKVMILSSVAGLDTAGIAEITGMTPGNVRQLLSRARKRLRDLLDNNS